MWTSNDVTKGAMRSSSSGMRYYRNPVNEQGRLQVKIERAGQRMTCEIIEISDDECQGPNNNAASEPPSKKSKMGCQGKGRSMEKTRGQPHSTKNESLNAAFVAGDTIRNKSSDCRGSTMMPLKSYCILEDSKMPAIPAKTLDEAKYSITKISQKREWTDEELARFLAHEEEPEVDEPGIEFLWTLPGDEDERDLMLALKLQKEEMEKERKRFGAATMFVQTLMDSFRPGGSSYEIVSQMPLVHQHMEVIAADDMVFLAERLLRLQAQFREQGIDSRVDIGYHYTKLENLERIRTDGLLTHSDRAAVGMAVSSCSSFGKGIYTANNPHTFSHFGPVGVIVARLKGACVQWDDVGRNESSVTAAMHTVIGNKAKGNPSMEEVVLRNSAQCLPLVCYNRMPLPTSDIGVQSVLSKIELSLQKLVDQFLICKDPVYNKCPSHAAAPSNLQSNVLAKVESTAISGNGKPSLAKASTCGQGMGVVDLTGQAGKSTRALPTSVSKVRQRSCAIKTVKATLPCHAKVGHGTVPVSVNPTETITYTAPNRFFQDQDDQKYFRRSVSNASPECAICLETFSMKDPPMALLTCAHGFHAKCIQDVLRHSSQCPVCRQHVREPQGTSPSGTMTVTWSSTPCPGFGSGTFVIDYRIPSGIQLAYHENHGHSFQGATRCAYVPDCDDGRRLVKRLKYAFMRGLTFTVGTSLSTGQANTVTWASIHHKTSMNGTVHGFPDAGYFINCNEELDNLGVPKAECLS